MPQHHILHEDLPALSARIYFFLFFLKNYAFSLLLPLKRMIYSCVIEYSGRILLPQNDKIRMYVITLGCL